MLIKKAKTNMFTANTLLDLLSVQRCQMCPAAEPGVSAQRGALYTVWTLPQALGDKLVFGFYLRTYPEISSQPRIHGVTWSNCKNVEPRFGIREAFTAGRDLN